MRSREGADLEKSVSTSRDESICYVVLTDQRQASIENNKRRSDTVFIPGPCEGEHDDRSGHVWRCDEALGGRQAEAHTVIQDNGKEI